MMQGQADREVLFVLKAVAADDAPQAFNRMATMAERANAQMLASAENAASQWAKAWSSAAEQMSGRRIDAERRATSRAAEDHEKALERRQERESKAQKAAERDAERARKAAEREAEKKFKTDLDLLSRAAKEEKRRWEAEKKERESAAESARKADERAARERERASRQYESSMERQQSLAMQSKMAVAEMGEGFTRMGRGVAQLGILSEETTEGLVRGFVKVQAGFDIVAGGLKVYRSLSQAVDAYTRSVEAAAVAERALAASRGQSAAAGGARLAGSGAAGGLLGGAALPIAGGAAILGAAALSGRALWERSHRTKDEDSWFTPDTTTAWGLGGLGWLAKLDPMGIADRTPFGKLADERSAMSNSAASTARMAAAREKALEEAERQRDEEAKRQQQFATLADAERRRSLLGLEVRPELGGVLQAGYGRQAELEATRPQFGATDQAKGEYALAQRAMERDLALQRQQTAAEAGLSGARSAADIESETYRQAREDAEAARDRMKSAESRGQTPASRAQLEAAVEATAAAEEEAASRMVAANQERIRQEEQIAAIRSQAAENAITKTQEEIALRDQLIEKDKQRLMTAAERIASMSESEQQQYGQLIQKARGGVDLSAEEFRRLGAVQTEETDSLVRQYAERRSKGFFEEYKLGDAEQRRIAENEKLQKELQVRLTDERKVSVDVQFDGERIVRDVTEAAREIIDQRLGAAVDRIRQELEGELNARDRQRAEYTQAREAGRRK